MFGKWFGHHQCTLCWQIPAALRVWWTNIAKQYSQTVSSKSTGLNVKLVSFHPEKNPEFIVKSSRVPNTWTKWMRAMRLTDHGRLDTHLPHVRQGCPFSSNPIAKTFHSLEDQTVGKGELLSWESQSSSNIVRVDVGLVNQWWIRMVFRCKFSVPKICCPRSKQLTVKFRLVVASCKRPRSKEELSRLSF